MAKHINAKNKDVLIISDTHFPHHHIDTIPFIRKIKKELNPAIVTHIGDEVDHHYLSFHNTIAECRGGEDELKESIIGLHKLYTLWDKMYLLDSNHGSLIFRRAKANGMSLTYIKSLADIYGVQGWTWHHDIILETKRGPIYLCHGKSSGYGRLCKELGMSAVQGHFHGKSEITWHRTVVSERFNMFVGAFADDNHIAMEYGKNNLPRTILGCGYIDKDGNPHLLRMNTVDGRWDKKLTII